MCGIVGLFAKNQAIEKNLGQHVSNMLVEMTDRGPDSAGIAIYHDQAQAEQIKITLLAEQGDYDWDSMDVELSATFSPNSRLVVHMNHAVAFITADIAVVRQWLANHHPNLRINSAGSTIEIYKAMGLPAQFVRDFDFASQSGTHALGHTRMATESAVTTEASHPFSTGQDLCLVHNGSLSNHHRLREKLRKQGITIQTDNDTEVAAGYLTWRLNQGDSLEQALQNSLQDLDGFYTFAIGTKDGFAVLRDPIGCKPAVMAETDDWVAMASEFRAIAVLPGVDNANIWEPEPTRIYSWERG